MTDEARYWIKPERFTAEFQLGGGYGIQAVEMVGWEIAAEGELSADAPRIIAETADTGGNLAVWYSDGRFQRYSRIEIAAEHRGFDGTVVLQRIRAIAPLHPLAVPVGPPVGSVPLPTPTPTEEDRIEAAIKVLRGGGFMVARIPECTKPLGHGRHILVTRSAACEGVGPIPHGYQTSHLGSFGMWVHCRCGHSFSDYGESPSNWATHKQEHQIEETRR